MHPRGSRCTGRRKPASAEGIAKERAEPQGAAREPEVGRVAFYIPKELCELGRGVAWLGDRGAALSLTLAYNFHTRTGSWETGCELG
jgi:hypothetical protein